MLFQNAVDTLNIPEPFKSQLKNEVSSGRADCMLALLLCKLPNVECLIVKRPYNQEWSGKLLEFAASGSLDIFGNLRAVSVTDYECGLGAQLKPEMMRILKLPSVKSFTGNLTQGYENMGRELKPGSSSVEHISFMLSAVTKEAIESIIRCCKVLKTFVFTGSTSVIIDFFRKTFTPHDAVQALRQHRLTLEELTIYIDEDDDVLLWNLEPEETCIGTALRDFENLRALRCEMVYLLGIDPICGDISPNQPNLVDTLPRSLETLVIFEASEKIIPQLESIRDVKPEQFPHLREIVVFFLYTVEETGWELQVHGVEVSFNYFSQTENYPENYIYKVVGHDPNLIS